jgi:hypothetical protein
MKGEKYFLFALLQLFFQLSTRHSQFYGSLKVLACLVLVPLVQMQIGSRE